MRLAEAWRVAVTALRANRLRSLLTMLGVVIGVAAVVVLVAIGTGAKQEVEQQVEGLGSNLVLIVPGRLDLGSAPTRSRLQLEDAELVGRAIGQPDGVAVTLTSGETVRNGGARGLRHRSTAPTRPCPASSSATSRAAATSGRPTSTPGAGSPCSAARWRRRCSTAPTRSAAR